jgi:hypothetical protein
MLKISAKSEQLSLLGLKGSECEPRCIGVGSQSAVSCTVYTVVAVEYAPGSRKTNNGREKGKEYSGRQKFCAAAENYCMFFKMLITRATDKIAKFCKQL